MNILISVTHFYYSAVKGGGGISIFSRIMNIAGIITLIDDHSEGQCGHYCYLYSRPVGWGGSEGADEPPPAGLCA